MRFSLMASPVAVAAGCLFPVRFASLIWLEQTKTGRFTRHRLERYEFGHVALEVGDFDDDGKPDLAVGNYGREPQANWATIWWNPGSI